ncbi:MAG: hypothetical protein V1837_01040 [Candidatus Woesearchaeota archaeon]
MKKGQEKATAASLVATIAGLIILYIIFLPPQDRAELLGEQPSSISGGGSPTTHETTRNDSIFSASPGKIFYQKLDEFEYDLSAFTLMKTTGASVISTANNFRVRNGWFDKITKNVTFTIADAENTDNVMLSFGAQRHTGTLTIKLNGAGIYDFEIDTQSPNPISLDKTLLKNGKNTLEFSVSGVGPRFWTTNEYSLHDIKIVGDVTDTTRQESKNTFYISPEESQNLEKAELKFNPDCRPSQTGILDVLLNQRSIFSGIPDCGTLNKYTFSPSLLNIGKNSINFKTGAGSYLVDQISVKTFLKQPVQPTFYFDLDENLFNKDKESVARCGDVDGICPNGCGKDLDKDCCFEEFPTGFFCKTKTEYIGDRCVGFVDKGSCNRCSSGYKDKNGEGASACEDLCGDDSDGSCPHGCLAKYDKDCCFELSEEQFWCKDLPITGEDFICMNDLTTSTCQNCETGYEAEGTGFDCKPITEEKKTDLEKGTDIILIFRFTESREDKEAEVWINGKQTSFATRESSYRKNINEFVEPGTNSILIKPKTDLDIRELQVKFD